MTTLELKSKAAVLKKEFHSLHLAVRESSIQMDFEKFKFLVQDLLTGHDNLEYSQCDQYLTEVRQLTNSSEILLFAVREDLQGLFDAKIGTWNSLERTTSQLLTELVINCTVSDRLQRICLQY